MANCDFSIEELCIIAIALDDEMREKKRTRRPRKIWVKKMLLKRMSEGEFHTLYRELEDDETAFYKYLRMSRQQFFNLLSLISERIKKADTNMRRAISPREKLMVCLRFLATGDSLQTIAFSFRLGHSTVHRIVYEVCQAIIDILLNVVMPPPTTEEWLKIADEFWSLWNFPNCIGAIDGKHVHIVAPPNSGSLYRNYKHTFSVVLLALVDANYKFRVVDIGAYGKNSDGGIFSQSNLGRALETNSLGVPADRNLPGTDTPAPFVIVGDEAFPLKTYLMRPFPRVQQSDCPKKKNFNFRLCRTRRSSESAFGQLAQKYRMYFRKINAHPSKVDKIILTTCILHNYIKDNNVIDSTEASNEELIFEQLGGQGGNACDAAFAVRQKFADFFDSPAGALPW